MSLLVISLDGADWNDWSKVSTKIGLSTPSFAIKNVIGTFPTDTYPSHVTILTGVYPEKHCIISNKIHGSSRWNREYSLIKSNTLFDIAKKSGLKIASISWPVTLGADVDILFPEIWPPDEKEKQLGIYRKNIRGIGDFFEKNKDLLGFFYGKDLDIFSAKVAEYILEKESPDLVFLHLSAIDSKKHNCNCLEDSLEEAYLFLSTLLKPVLEKAQGYDMVFLSDHSQIPCLRKFSIKSAVASIGLELCFEIEENGLYSYIYTKDEIKTKTIIDKIRDLYPDILGELVDKESAKKRWHIQGDFSFILESGNGIYFSPGKEVFSDITKGSFSQSAHGYFPDKGPFAFLAGYSDIYKGEIKDCGSLVDIAPTLALLLGEDFDVDGNALDIKRRIDN